VHDTGCGLTEEQQHRLFQPFTQADSSVTRRFGGTGLGLSLARRLAQALGGEVVLTESKFGEGSTFVITIDTGSLEGVAIVKGLTRADLDRSKQVVSDWFVANKKLEGVRVLLVEDGPDNQALMSHFLRISGANVEGAVNGIQAIEKAESGHFDVILMDIQMPILDGYEATKRLCAKGYQSPIVALTAHAMRGERERCLAAGCVDYISKPVRPGLLVEVVERITKKKVEIDLEECGRSLLADDKIVGPLVPIFVGNLPKRIAAIRSAQQRADYEEIANQAHQMAGAAGGYGFPKMGRAAAKIEAQAKDLVNPAILAKSIERFNCLCQEAVLGNPPFH
jgi:CheY-like chemotaxis protein/HPt (histidine-containing phosphotransfer) domain-containing protein